METCVDMSLISIFSQVFNFVVYTLISQLQQQ